MRAYRLPWATLAPLAVALAVGAAHAGEPRNTINAVRVERGPKIDGRLDDGAWRSAHSDDRFTQNFPDEDKAPSQRTELYVVYDDKALYLGVRCHDTDPKGIVGWLTRRDRDTSADKVTIDIDSRDDHTSAYHFDVNVSGVLADGVRFNDLDYNTDWDGVWNAVTTRDAGGWTAEFEIPWRTLRFDGREPVMGLQVRRYIQRRQEVDEWVYVPRTAHAEVSRYGSLTGLTGLGPKRLLQLVPYVAAGLSVRSGLGASETNGVHFVPNAGLDAKIGLTSSLTLDATINPDFGQVEADQVVLNLTTFEVFYPEKRPFFLEGVELFATPVQQFYTRRVGRAPPAFNANPNQPETLVDEPLTGRIWGAAKLSGQIVPHLSIAALDAVTAEQSNLVLRAGATMPEPRQVDPLANYAVLRLRGDWGANYFGVMATAVNRFESNNAATPQPTIDLCAGDEAVRSTDGRCTHDAYTQSVDMRLQTADGAWTFTGQAIASRLEHGSTRVQPDGTRLGAGATGYGVYARLAKLGGERFVFSARYEGYTPLFDMNDAGYLRAANSHSFVLGAGPRTTRPLGPTLESSFEAYATTRLAWDGTLVDASVGAGPWARFRNFWQAWIGGGWVFDRWDNRETHDGALTRRSFGFWAEAWMKSDPRRALTGELNLHINRVRHGYSTSGDVTFSVRPLPQLDLQIIPRVNYTWGDPRWAETDPDGRRYWFGDLQSQSYDVTLRGIYTFTPRLSFQLYAQVFVAGGHYSNWMVATIDQPLLCADGRNPCPRAQFPLSSFVPVAGKGAADDFASGQVNLNAVLRWEYLPGSTLIAVYTRSQQQPGFDSTSEMQGGPSLARFRSGSAVDNVLVKASYLWR